MQIFEKWSCVLLKYGKNAMWEIECGNATWYATQTHRIPFGHHPLFLESGEFSSIVDGCENLPHQDQCQTDGDDGANHAQNDT